MPCINILAHLYRRVQRSCSYSSPPSSERLQTGPSGKVPGRLMDGTRPPWPTEFYLRLTSRCCHRRSTRSTTLINLSPPLLSICLLHLSLHSPPPISLPLSSYASHSQSLPLLLLPLPPSWASRHRSSLWHGGCPSSDWQTRWREKLPRRYTHMHVQPHAHLFIVLKGLDALMGVDCHLLVLNPSNTKSMNMLIWGVQANQQGKSFHIGQFRKWSR